MEVIILATISAAIIGLNATIIRKGIHRKPFSLNSIISSFVAGIILWLFVFIVKSPMPSKEAIPFFIVAGILAPGFASILNFESVKRIRATLTSSLLATIPLFGTILAIIFLGERINSMIALGTLSIVLGVFLLSRFRPKKHVKLRDFSFALGGAMLIATSTIFSKAGLNISNLPYSGIAIAISAGVITHFIIITVLKKWNTISTNFHDAKFFIISGTFISIALLFLFTALSIGNVVVVVPLTHTQPLFALFFAWLLLRKHEPLTKHIILGAVTIVIGSFLVSMGA
ncbi:hypothetical protein CMO93_00165 [Candidatus Woesearchaeota archaeon]|nr:hypothetical protein [Candidatus Woesearchaeota archaeon]